MVKIEATINPVTNEVVINRDKVGHFIDPLDELNDWLEVTVMVAKRAQKYQEITPREMVNYCGNYLKGRLERSVV